MDEYTKSTIDHLIKAGWFYSRAIDNVPLSAFGSALLRFCSEKLSKMYH